MIKALLSAFLVSFACSSVVSSSLSKSPYLFLSHNYEQIVTIIPNNLCLKTTAISLEKVKAMLQESTLSLAVIDKVLKALQCAEKYNVTHNNSLVVIDYSLPSSVKRLWIFDLQAGKLLFYTYVTHGIKSGALLSSYFSNRYDSKMSSIGVYKTEKVYYGRDGISLRLEGLEKGFNDNAMNRSVVMHGGWYATEQFIQKYGRAGRSWGCPALPLDVTKEIINTIKNNSLLLVYYPNEDWFLKSKFLRCNAYSSLENITDQYISPLTVEDVNDKREDILFADVKAEPVVVMPADSYQRLFQAKVPVNRMLRRQIEGREYIALSNPEIKYLVLKSKFMPYELYLNEVFFVVPDIKMIRGYYETQMKRLPWGKITEIKLGDSKHYTVYFAAHAPVTLQTTTQFIRWVGL